MKKGLVMVLAAALLAFASTASAQVFGKGKAQFSFGLTHFTAHTADTINSVSGEFLQSNGLIGFGGELRYGFSPNWAITGGGFFGFGSDKVEFSVSGDVKSSYSAFGLRLGLDHTINLSDETGLYMGPGFEFASAKSKQTDEVFAGYTDEDNPRLTSFSLDGRVGVIHKLGEHFGLNGSMGKKWSYVSKSFDSGSFGEELKVTRWLSSVNGWAGFVVLF